MTFFINSFCPGLHRNLKAKIMDAMGHRKTLKQNRNITINKPVDKDEVRVLVTFGHFFKFLSVNPVDFLSCNLLLARNSMVDLDLLQVYNWFESRIFLLVD